MGEQSVQDVAPATHDVGDDGYHKSLKARHINMIAIGGAIGTGLFLGAGGRLVEAGPSLAIAYAVCANGSMPARESRRKHLNPVVVSRTFNPKRARA